MLLKNAPLTILNKGGRIQTLYERLRLDIPPGKKGWGASGKLDLDLIGKMASA